MFDSVDQVIDALAVEGFSATRATATAVYLAAKVGNPLFIQGPHGTGKTSLARAVAKATDAEIVDLRTVSAPAAAAGVHARTFLLLDDLKSGEEALLQLARELLTNDRTSDEPAGLRPLVAVTSASNHVSVAERSDRCRIVTLCYPVFELEARIVMERVPGLSRGLVGQVCNVAARLRAGAFVRPPGVGESISWARSLVAVRCPRIDAETLADSAAKLFSLPKDLRAFRAVDPATMVTPGLTWAA